MTTTPKIAFLFPGQGAQSVGMGKDLSEASKEAAALFALADSLVATDVGHPLSTILFEGPEGTLKRTVYTQPGILTVALAAWQLFTSQCPNVQPVAVAGHSLGEFAALVAAHVLTPEAALKLVAQRSALMEQAPAGTMAAVLGLDSDAIQATFDAAHFTHETWMVIANDNCPGQVVISGTACGLERVTPLLKAAGAKRVLPLPVGGAFHSPLMEAAAETFATVISHTPFAQPSVPVVCNVHGRAVDSADALQQHLQDQMPSSVRWTQTMATLVNELGASTIIEFGPGKVLSGMMKKTHPHVAIYNVFDVPSLEATVAAFSPTPA